jgi:ABC-type transport system involved in multi-copper enzyme maturation permease subunit
MSRRIWAIALNTFREAVRNKILYAALFVAVASNLLALALGEMSLHEEARVARDVGLATISLFGSLIAVAMGITLLYNEIQRKTVHTVLSKPIARWEFVVGKYLGMATTLSLVCVVLSLSTAGVLRTQGVGLDAAITKAMLLSWMEVLCVAGLAIFFSSFSTPFVSGAFTLFVWVIGRATPEMRYAIEASKDPFIKAACHFALRVFPDLHVFAVSGSELGGKHVTVHASFVSWGYVAQSAGYAAIVIAILLVLSTLIFSRREFV